MSHPAPKMPPAGKFDGVETLPLFDLDSGGHGSPRDAAARRTPPPHAKAPCPRCSHLSVGLEQDAGHLRYRTHNVLRDSGPSTPCSASGAYLHDLPTRHGMLILTVARDGLGLTRPALCGCEPAEDVR